MLPPLFRAVQTMHFHGWLFGSSPYRFKFNSDKVEVETVFEDFIPTGLSLGIGTYGFLYAFKIGFTGFSSSLRIVSIFQDGLLCLMFFMYMGTTLFSFLMRHHYVKIVNSLNSFDREVMYNVTLK